MAASAMRCATAAATCCQRAQMMSASALPAATRTALSSSFVPKGLVALPARTFSQGSSGHRRTFQRGLAARAAADVEQLRGAKEAIKELIQSKSCTPILIRLGWHDSGTYDKNVSGWPAAGGATASIRFKPEIDHAANAGLASALALLAPIKEKFPTVSYSDLFQLASATAVEVAGGPKIPMKYGRVDADSPKDCSPEGNLPDAGPQSPADHLRKVFDRMGLNDKEIVALSGAHTLGRARPERSGWGKAETKYTKDGPGLPGGQSWTVDWLKFDNSYFKDVKEKKDADLLVLPTDAALFEDAEFKKYAELYAADQDAFFADYADAHKKLSELGSKFDPPEGVYLPEKFSAAEYSSKSNISNEMKERLRKEYVSFGGSPNQPLQSNYFLNIIIAVSVLAVLAWLTGAI